MSDLSILSRLEFSPVTVHGLFSRQAVLYPDKVAVTADDRSLTYSELDAQSSLLSDQLHGMGVVTGDVIAILLERSALLIVAMLGVLKAGASFTTLDPSQPADRHKLLIKDAGCAIVIASGALAAEIDSGVAVFNIDAADNVPFIAAAVPDTALSGSHSAYVAYTSGSTGRPKGVSVPHRAIIRLVVDSDYISIRPDDVFLQLAPVAFDASTFEIWGALLNGAQLVIASIPHPMPADITSIIAEKAVTVAWLTAGLFHAVVDYGTSKLDGLRYLLAGGDVLSAPHVAHFLSQNPEVVLINGYGPTENTTFTTCHTFTEPERDDAMPIGRPIRNTSVYLLDDEMRPVPDGTIGEIVAGGMGLAHGYLNDAVLTAEKFVPNPFSDLPGERLYRTGDLGRRRVDGTIEFRGRIDDQVKIRGFRIEPREVEAALKANAEVSDAVVVVQEIAGGRQLLACYIANEPLTSAELRWQLGLILPNHMIPAAFVRFSALPLNINGKVDRPFLSKTTRPARPELSTGYVPPQTPTSSWLAQMWADLLEIEFVGEDDDFFEIGGHSLMAVRITSEISVEYNVTVPPIEFYSNSTIKELAEFIDELTAVKKRDATPTTTPNSIGTRTSL